jgi:PAS domain S-box-containing protein
MIKYYLSVAVGNGINSEKNKRLANELAFQNKLIQNQHDDMRKRLKDKELLVYHLVNLLSDEVAYILDASYKVICWNKSAVALYGLSMDEAYGRHIEQIHLDMGWGSLEDVLLSVLTQGRLEHITWVTDRRGKRRRFNMQFTRLEDDKPLGIVVRINEIEEGDGLCV